MCQSDKKETLRFTVFADLHYKKDVYIAAVSDLEAVLQRADRCKAAFAIHLGDFSNDYIHSPEITQAYLENPYGLPVYGIYGNHELEWQGNRMDLVTPLLNNRAVTWGTADGQIGDGSIGYYYTDMGAFRLVCVDTNHCQDVATGAWLHYPSGSEGSVPGARNGHSLDPVQLSWLDGVLTDAAAKGLHCLVFSHAGFCDAWSASPSAGQVRALFDKANGLTPGTVLLACNGHLHSNHAVRKNGVVYVDVHTVRNALWVPNDRACAHYSSTTFPCVEYDEQGTPTGHVCDRAVNTLGQAKNTWFSARPLSAIITVSTDGRIEIEGIEGCWLDDVVPPFDLPESAAPRITSTVFEAL